MARQRLLYQAWIIGAAVLVLFTNLGGAGLWDNDEPYYAACAREMLDRHDWVVPTFNGSLFPEKPPLMYWMMMAGFKVFGVHEFGARCGAALCGVATALGTYVLGRRLFSPEAGLWGGLIVVSTFLFTISARAATVDSALALLSVGAMLALVYGKMPRPAEASNEQDGMRAGVDGPHFWLSALAMHFCLAVGVLAKGPIGLLLPAASIGLFLMVTNHLARTSDESPSVRCWPRMIAAARLFSPVNFVRSLWQMRPVLGVLVVLVVAAPWFIVVSLRTHGEWPAEFFGNYNLRPFVKPILGHSGPLVYYVPVLLAGLFPWSVFLIPAIVDGARRVRHNHPWSPGYVLLGCWAVVPFLFWSICSSKLPHYMVPIVPALALAVGAFLDHAVREPAVLRRGLIWSIWGTVILIGVALVIVIPIVSADVLPGEGAIGLVGLILVVGGAISLRLLRQQRSDAATIAFAAMAVLLMTAIFGFALLRVDRHQNTRALMAAIRRDCPGEPRLAAYRFMEKSYVF